MLSYANRFHGHGSLRYVFKNGDTVRSRLMTVRYSRNPRRKQPRFSVSISKKIFKSAVKRNRVRRRVYEIVRLALPRITGAHDAVLIVTSTDLLWLAHDDLKAAVHACLSEAGLLPTPEA